MPVAIETLVTFKLDKLDQISVQSIFFAKIKLSRLSIVIYLLLFKLNKENKIFFKNHLIFVSFHSTFLPLFNAFPFLLIKKVKHSLKTLYIDFRSFGGLSKIFSTLPVTCPIITGFGIVCYLSSNTAIHTAFIVCIFLHSLNQISMQLLANFLLLTCISWS